MKYLLTFFTALSLAGCASVSSVEQPAAEQPVADLPLVGTYWVLELIETPAYRADLTEALETSYDNSPSRKAPAYLYFSDRQTQPDIVNFANAPEESWALFIGLGCGSGAGWYAFGSEPIIYLNRGVAYGPGCTGGYWKAIGIVLRGFLFDATTYRIEGDKLRFYPDVRESDDTFLEYRARPMPERW
jgi:hypothetical protein